VWNRSTAAAAPVGAADGDSRYDITVVGPNRFLRRFTGDTTAAGAHLSAVLIISKVASTGTHGCSSR
jgi:phospholipase C